MIYVRNIYDKLICGVDKNEKKVEIVSKGVKTTITFLPNGEIQIDNKIEEK